MDIDRRKFVLGTAVVAAARFAQAADVDVESSTFRMVAAQDRGRIILPSSRC